MPGSAKLQELNEAATVALTDEVMMVDDPAVTPVSMQTTVEKFLIGVVPGWAGSADRVGNAGGSISEEYEVAAAPYTGLTWSGNDDPPDTVDVNTTLKSRLYLAQSWQVALRTIYGLRDFVPGAGVFDVRAELGLNSANWNGSGGGLVLTNSDLSVVVKIVSYIASVAGLLRMRTENYTLASGTWTQRGLTHPTDGNHIYHRISRDGSDNVTAWWSNNGLIWMPIATTNFAITVAKVGYNWQSDSGSSQISSDWLRCTP